jgi:hypothetical protein
MGTGGPLNIWLLSDAGPLRAFSANFKKSNTESPGGGGSSKVCEFWGRLPHGVPRADFFWRGQTFDYFLEIKDFKRRPRSPSGSIASLFNGLRRRPPSIGNTAALARRIFFRHAQGSPGGISKFGWVVWTTAWQAHAFFREIPETFFGRPGSEKTPRNSGWGGR